MPLNASVEDGDHFGVAENISTTAVAEVFFPSTEGGPSNDCGYHRLKYSWVMLEIGIGCYATV